jgi:dihydrofolate synthase/folylpolyglutamate synthase
LPGEHQKLNAALALATVEILQKQIPVSEEQTCAGLQNINWPGRLQLVEKTDGRKILLDGAHNLAGAKVLREAVRQQHEFRLQNPGVALILGILRDKDWRGICKMLAPLADKIFAVPVASERTTNPNELAEICRAANPAAEIFVCGSLSEALQKGSAENFIVLTGSLYLVGEALELLGLSPAAAGERALNEWTAAQPASAS